MTLLWLFLLLLLCPPVVMLFVIILGERRKTAIPSFWIPPAAETAASVRRFRKAAERDLMLDFVWERYSHGRALLVDDFRRRIVATRRRRAQRLKPIAPWI